MFSSGIKFLFNSAENFVNNNFVSQCQKFCKVNYNFCLSVGKFVRWITILPYNAKKFEKSITILSHSVEKLGRWITNLPHGAKEFEKWITILSHSVEKPVQWIEILSHSAEICVKWITILCHSAENFVGAPPVYPTFWTSRLFFWSR